MLKLTTDKHEASCGLSATAELLVFDCISQYNPTTPFARNLGFIFNKHLIFSDQIFACSKSCYCKIHELCCICPYLDFKTASTTATSIVRFNLTAVILSITIFQTRPAR